MKLGAIVLLLLGVTAVRLEKGDENKMTGKGLAYESHLKQISKQIHHCADDEETDSDDDSHGCKPKKTLHDKIS